MDYQLPAKRFAATTLLTTVLTTMLTACGGDGASDEPIVPPPSNNKTAQLSAQLKTMVPLIGVSYRNASNSLSGTTNSTGDFNYKSGDTVIFNIAGKDYSITPHENNNDFLAVTASAYTRNNLKTVLINLDHDNNASNGIDLSRSTANINPSYSEQTINKLLYKSTGRIPKLAFSPSLGINTEAPQGGADTAGMPMPFVDIFRTARPFKEQNKAKKDDQGNIVKDGNGRTVYIPAATQYDENGWPLKVDPELTYSRTKMLQGALKGSIPDGNYTVIYDGEGTIDFSPHGALSASSITKVANENKYTLALRMNSFDPDNEAATASANNLSFGIKNISPNHYIKNIRVIMPGGTCTGNPFIRVDSQSDCPTGKTYQSFADRLEGDRNAIIFNPDYLMFLRNFKVIRMMNLMEASLKKLCFDPNDCPAGVGSWDSRAKMDDAVWGGNDGRTAHQDHKGVPPEVMVALANTLKRDIWVNMPHVATNDYVKQYAKYVHQHLDSSLKIYVEYSNEVWNPGFAAHAYTIAKGKALHLDSVPQQFADSQFRGKSYFARLRYYSQRSEEIFNIWSNEFNRNPTRLKRILGSFIGDRVLTDQMLKHIGTDNVDAVAIAPYFFGCPYEDACVDAPKNLADATSVDDIFDIIDQSATNDVKSLDGTIEAVKNQLIVVNDNHLKLVTYEGGQHLVTGVLGRKIAESEKPRLRKLFNQANRDPRMKARYFRFLNKWKGLASEGTTLFTLYTLPQSYYRYGNFGIKEHLNKPRSQSPKFDGAMSFQESAGSCWWDDCNP